MMCHVPSSTPLRLRGPRMVEVAQGLAHVHDVKLLIPALLQKSCA